MLPKPQNFREGTLVSLEKELCELSTCRFLLNPRYIIADNELLVRHRKEQYLVEVPLCFLVSQLMI